VRLYPTREQERQLGRILRVCCTLYNSALDERKAAYKRYRLAGKPKDFVWPTLATQVAEYKEIRSEWGWVRAVYSETLRDTLRKIDVAMAAFMARVARGETPGYPRFKSWFRYDTFTYPHGMRAVKVHAKTLKLPGELGSMKYRRSGRDLPEKFGVVRISRSCGRWYASFEHVIEAKERVAPGGSEAGVDVGIAKFAALSNGGGIANPKWGRSLNAEPLQQALSRCKPRSKRRRKAVLALAKCRAREARQRRAFAHEESRQLANSFAFIAFEDLKILNMTRSAKGTVEQPGTNVAAKAGLNRSIADAGWRQFMDMVLYKAEEAGGQVVFVNPKNTSLTCNECGFVAKENRLSQAVFHCGKCSHEANADVNAARNILKKARLGLALAA